MNLLATRFAKISFQHLGIGIIILITSCLQLGCSGVTLGRLGGRPATLIEAVVEYEQPIQVPDVVSLSLYPVKHDGDKALIEILNGESRAFITRVYLSGEEKRLGRKISFEIRIYGALKSDAILVSDQNFVIEHGMRYGTAEISLKCSIAGELTSNDDLDEPERETETKIFKIYSRATRERISSPSIKVACIPPS